MGRQDFETETLLAVGGFPSVDIAPTVRAGGNKTGGDRPYGTDVDTCDSLVISEPAYSIRTANTSSNGWGIQEDVTHTLDRANGVAVAFNLRGRDGGSLPEVTDVASVRAASGGRSRSYVSYGISNQPTQKFAENLCPCLDAKESGGGRIATGMAVRRLTPVECERLQGFPDNYTLVPFRNKPAADGPRYKAIGNSMAVPVMRYIGERIQMFSNSRTK